MQGGGQEGSRACLCHRGPPRWGASSLEEVRES
ncbi:hypothetical protein Cadr_000013943 [Camelus dromedarius]|uniref:Uncharacterized protein n=1 Tax=Camelus dromedarius TaxID=9838 RepID=A0A5N4DDB1_CAMDR|nr:hypothetical protein Cadr_000013943 [Camelus dromedarius]